MNTFDASNAQFLSNLSLIQARSDRAQQQITSTYRVSQVSDDPASVTDILSLTMEISRTSQVKTNLSTVKAEVDTAETTVNQAVLLVQQAVSLAAQGASTGASAATRTSLAQQVAGIFDQLVGLTSTQVQGRYIFSGDASKAPTYQKNLANPNGVDRLVQTTSTRLVEDATGMTFGVGKTAQDIFDHRNADDSLAPDNVFAALNGLRTALANNDSAGIDGAITAVKTSADYLNVQQEFYGSVQTRIDGSMSTADQVSVRQQAGLSDLRDADVAAQALELTQSKTALQAAMSAQSLRQRNSLFDYLK